MRIVKLSNGCDLVLFWHDWLSNFKEAPFTWPSVEIPIIQFKTTEQGFMWCKAITFRDYYTAEKISETGAPEKAKALGREVRGYRDDVWDQVRFRVMAELNYQKYLQNPGLGLENFPPGTRFAEASPIDRIWGIGMSSDTRGCEDSRNWKGQNLMGKVLEEVHSRLLCRKN